MGLAFSDYSEFNDDDDEDYSGIINTMINQGQFGEKVFAFGIAGDSEEGERSELTLGGVNGEMYRGDFTYVDLTNEVSTNDSIFRSASS